MSTTLVFGGGPLGDDEVRNAIRQSTLELGAPERIVAADSGLSACMRVGMHADVVIGDMDSVDPELLDLAARSGSEISRHPPDKDATDLELALQLALEGRPERIVVIASAGGRLDHLLGLAALLGSPRLAGCEIEAWLGRNRILPVHDRRCFEGTPGALVSLLSLHGSAHGVSTEGFRWTLTDATLTPESTVGVSNRFAVNAAEVRVVHGVVTVVIPDPEVEQVGGRT